MSNINKIDQLIDKISLPIYYWMVFFLYFLYIVAILGISYFNDMQKYTHYLNTFIQGFIAIILIIRFNPFRHTKLVESDIPIIFASALFLLLNAGITGWVFSFAKNDITQIISLQK